jgi:hypothetical protein
VNFDRKKKIVKISFSLFLSHNIFSEMKDLVFVRYLLFCGTICFGISIAAWCVPSSVDVPVRICVGLLFFVYAIFCFGLATLFIRSPSPAGSLTAAVSVDMEPVERMDNQEQEPEQEQELLLQD